MHKLFMHSKDMYQITHVLRKKWNRGLSDYMEGVCCNISQRILHTIDISVIEAIWDIAILQTLKDLDNLEDKNMSKAIRHKISQS